MKQQEEVLFSRKQLEMIQKIEWMEAQLRIAIRDAEIVSQHFHNIVEQARRLSGQARRLAAVDEPTALPAHTKLVTLTATTNKRR